MTYNQALAEAKKIGVSKCEGFPHLAITIQALSTPHAVIPELIYNGALKKGLSAKDVRKLTLDDFFDLMFV